MMTKNDKIKSKGTSTPADSSLGLAIGLSLGTLFGIVTDNLALGMMIGVAVGLCGGSAAGALKGKKKETSDASQRISESGNGKAESGAFPTALTPELR